MPLLTSYHTFGLNSACQKITPISAPEEIVPRFRDGDPSWLLGGGSNTIFLEDFAGQVLINRIMGLQHQASDTQHTLRVGAGENWHALVVKCLEQGWHGMENLALIPGSVGAAPIQNIGAYGLEAGAFIQRVEAVMKDTGEAFALSGDECRFGYRDSIFKHELADRAVITHVTFALPKRYTPVISYGELAALDTPTPARIFDEVVRVRKAKLPDVSELGNAGSFFKNPVITHAHYNRLNKRWSSMPGYAQQQDMIKVPAAWLIDQLGFKGRQVNGVRCHPTQPLVLTNLGHANGNDVIALAKDIMVAVRDTFDITLEPEVRLVGREGLIAL